MINKILTLLFCALFSAPALSAADAISRLKNIYFNAGTHTEFYNALQMDDSGGLRKFDFAPTIGLGFNLPIYKEFGFFPEFNWVLPQLIEESNIIVNTFMYRFDFGYDPLDWLRLRLGTGILQMNQHGRGGKSKQRNGTGTSTFYYPDENRSSVNNTLDVGVEFLYENYAFRLQTYTYSIFREERRQLSYTLFLTYYWEKQ